MTELERAVGVDRECPGEVLAQLRVIDPTAELLYFGFGRWILGRVLSSAPIRAAGERLAASNERAVALRTAGQLVRPDYDRHWLARARLYGFQPTAEYRLRGEPTGAIARDQEVMQFLHTHLSMDETFRLNDKPALAKRANAQAQTRDQARARDAWRWLFTRSHSVTRFERQDRARSGFTIQRRVRL